MKELFANETAVYITTLLWQNSGRQNGLKL